MYLIVHGEGLAKANNQHGGVLLVHRGVVKVDVVHQLDRLGVVHGRPAHGGDGDDGDDNDNDLLPMMVMMMVLVMAMMMMIVLMMIMIMMVMVKMVTMK